MAVLKRFSYDNIVEHNPTAPDPVEGGGSKIYFGGTYSAYFPDGIITPSEDVRSIECTIGIESSPMLPNVLNPRTAVLYNIYSLSIPEVLKDYYCGYDIIAVPNGQGGLFLNISMNVLPTQNAITLPEGFSFMSFMVLFAEISTDNVEA